MARAEITKEGVLKAIAEFDELGRNRFLERYGFKGARDYFLVHDGKNYDSKAILAVAQKWAPQGDGLPLKWNELSGGVNDAAKKLRDLGFSVTTPAQNADWSWEEHVLALDLYMKNRSSPPGKTSSEIAELSASLNRLGHMNGVAMTEKFRNTNGVYMKLMNFRRLDPEFQSQGKSGLSQGSKGEEEVWDRYGDDLLALREEAEAIRSRIPQAQIHERIVDRTGLEASDSAFREAFEDFRTRIAAQQKDVPFRNFQEGAAAAWEDYKPRLRERALEILNTREWDRSKIGSGEILERVIEAIEVQDPYQNLTNNLVFWQNRFGHANRDHRVLLEARVNPPLRQSLEELLFKLYQGSEEDEGKIFDTLNGLVAAKYPLLAYLFFLKDMDRFMPIQPTGFDEAFRRLEIPLTTLRNCSWENYTSYNQALQGIRGRLRTLDGLHTVRLVDAHSFCWLLVRLPEAPSAGSKVGQDVGRIIGGREKSILKIRYSIQETVRRSNGQLVQSKVKDKELKMSGDELEQLVRDLLEIQGDRCALTGIPFHFDGPDADKNLLPSPDRKDSNGHYELGNLQLVCRFVNFWKGATPNDEFVSLLGLVRGIEV